MQSIMLGVAEVDITPLSPVQTVGFGRPDEMSQGVLHSLSAQASVWQCGDERCCLVAVDHIGFSTNHADSLRKELAALLSVSPEQVMLCFSHTHSAPNDSVERDYFSFVSLNILKAAAQALSRLAPVVASWANAVGNIGMNRRPGKSELDRRIGILKAVDAQTGKLRLLLLRLTAHANALKEDNYLISPDYFGAVRDLLSSQFGCPVMLTQGASGNVSPWYYRSSVKWTKENPAPAYYGVVQSDDALEDMAREVLRAVRSVIGDMDPAEPASLRMYSVHLELCADVPQMKEANRIADEALRCAGIDGTAWLAEVQRLHDQGVTIQKNDVELQYFVLGKGCLCGLSNEIMCESALRASEQTGCSTFYLGGYTNGCTGYLSTEEEYDRGGFEVHWSMLIYWPYYHRVAALNRDSASRVVDCAVGNAPQFLNKSLDRTERSL